MCVLTLTNIFFVAYRLRNFYIEVLSGKVDNDPPVCYHQKEPAGGVLQAYCVKPLTGSWLKIRKDVIDPNDDMITLCEVVVTATQEGKQSGDGFSSRL